MRALIDSARHAITAARRPSGARRRGAFGLWLAVLALVGQVGGVAHFALASHAVCAEHGEVVDVGHRASAPHAPRGSAVAHTTGADDDAFAAGDEAEAEHDHCLIALEARRRVALERLPSLGERPVVASSITLVPRAALAPASSKALLLVAPKTSPPSLVG